MRRNLTTHEKRILTTPEGIIRKQVAVMKLWVRRCRLVKERIHATTFKEPFSTEERERLWTLIEDIDEELFIKWKTTL